MADWLDQIMQANASMSPQAQANTALTQAQTVGAGIQNQENQLSLDFRRQFLSGMTPGAAAPPVNPNSTAEQEGDLALDSGKARAMLQQRFQPVADVWTPQEMQQRMLATASGIPGALDMVKAQHDARIQNQNQQRIHDATQMYSHLYGVVTAPEGQAMDVLRVAEPDTADRFEQAGMTDAQVRQHAADLAGLTHSVAQLPIEFNPDGTAMDARTKEEIPGYDAAVGMSAKDRAGVITELTKPTTIKNSDGTESTVPTYQAIYGQNAKLEDAVNRATNLANMHRAAPSTVAPAIAAARNPAPAASATPGASAAAPGAARPQTAGAPSPSAVAQATLARIPPAERANYTNPDYQLPPEPPVVRGTSAPQEVIDERKAIVKARTDLLAEQGANTVAAGQALRYYKLAQDVLNSGNVITGWSAEQRQHAATMLQTLHIPVSWLGDPNKTADVVKNTVNAGLQNLKSTYGSKIAQSEVFLNLNKASPNVDMPLPALSKLINEQIDNMNYAVESGKRANKYLATNNDPRKFDQWNQDIYPRQNAGAAPAAGPAPAKLQGPTIANQKAYDALPNGAPYISGGKQHYKGGR